jgi:DNA-binding cell septation regulator SpoVG
MSNEVQKAINAILPQAISDAIPQAISAALPEFRSIVAEENSISNESIKASLNDLQIAQRELKDSNNEMKEAQRDLGARFDKLQNQVETQRETLKEEIKNDLMGEFKVLGDATHKALLAQEIEKTASNIVLHGFKPKDAKKDIQSIFSSIAKDEEIEVKNVRIIGGKGNTMIVTLGNEYQRNSILRESRHLPNGVTVDKDVPKCYKKKYDNLKKEAWRQRSFFNLKTQIIFTGHLLQLRIKEDGKGFIIHTEFCPSPQELFNQSKTGADNLPPTNITTMEAKDKAARSFVVSNYHQLTADEIRRNIDAIIPPSESGKIQEVEIAGRYAKIICSTVNNAKDLATQLNKKKIGDFEFSTSTYSS